jgi:hypothetical protein
VSYFLSLLCRCSQPLTVGFVSEFLEEGVFFDETPELYAFPTADLDSGFERIEVRYHPKRRPIIIESSSAELVKEETSEILDLWRSRKAPNAILKHLASVTQIIAFELDQPRMTDEAWSFCDCIEAHIAKKLDAIIYAPDDGFYDQDLQLIHAL